MLDKRLQDVQSTLKGSQSAASPTPGAAGSGTTSTGGKSGTPQLAAAVAGNVIYLLPYHSSLSFALNPRKNSIYTLELGI